MSRAFCMEMERGEPRPFPLRDTCALLHNEMGAGDAGMRWAWASTEGTELDSQKLRVSAPPW